MDWQVEIIHWSDPYSVDEWTELSNLDKEMHDCAIISVGFVVKETENMIAIALNLDLAGKEPNVSCVMIIQKKMILKRKKVNGLFRKAKRR